MNEENRKKVEELLLDYLKKATGTNATEHDIANIPEVARI